MEKNKPKRELERVFQKFKRPMDIQLYLNSVKYNPKDNYKSPLRVVKEKKAHCFEGAVFAAAALRYMGKKPLIIDMVAKHDYDHVVAVFKKNNCWGAISKSNTTTLRYREPVYRSLRELCMSYFDVFFNSKGVKSLRKYSAPLNLEMFDSKDWLNAKEDLDYIAEHLDKKTRHYNILKPAMIRSLEIVDKDVYKASLLGADRRGLYKVEA